MNRILIFISITSLFWMGCENPSVNEPKRPNIVFLLADDMGYGDFEKVGGSTKTPNLNRLAEEGVFLIIFMPQGPTAPLQGQGL